MGRFIAIDGLDGSGKGTQTALLCDYLEKKSIKVRRLTFPTYTSPGCDLVSFYLGGGLGEHPDDTGAYAASVFYACDRYVSYRTDWKKDIEDADTVTVADRYTTANAVHQLSKLPVDKWDEFLSWLWDFEFDKMGLPRPDDVVYLEVPPDISRVLVTERGNKKDIHEKDEEYLERSYSAAKYCAEKLGWHRIKCCTGGKIMSKEEISALVRGCLGV